MPSFLILLVDDNPRNLQILGNILEGEYETAVAFNGREALAFVRKKRPDLILMDVLMPEMNGFEVCETLQKDPMLKDAPVIFITAKTDTESVVKGFEIGGVDYITKPFNASELLARVKSQLTIKSAKDIQNNLILEKERLISRLQKALDEIKTLRGLVPICSFCKKIRNDRDFWEVIDAYIERHTEAKFSHGCCPDCVAKYYPKKKKNRKKDLSPRK